MRSLARRLIAVEAATPSNALPQELEAVRVCEKLRVPLTRFAGTEGFTSLLRRALALAREDVPALQAVTVTSEGCQGLEVIATADRTTGIDAAVAITAHLLGLLVTFIGESLTLRMVREAWPDIPLNASAFNIGDP